MRVLHVEDDLQVGRLLKSISERIGEYDCDVAATFAHACELILNKEYDLVTLDLNLGAEDGRSLISRVKLENHKAIIAIMSGNTPEGTLAEDIDLFIPKPIDIKNWAALLMAVEKIQTLRQSLAQMNKTVFQTA